MEKYRGLNIIWDDEEKQYYVEGHSEWGWFGTVADAKKQIDLHLGPRRKM